MTTTPPIIDEAEGFVHELATELTRVRAGECLCCYMARQLEEYPCDNTLRHAFCYRDAVAPRATALHDRLSRLGGYCDCELFLNGYEWHPPGTVPVREVDDDGFVTYVGVRYPEPPPPCAGVRRGSVRPCSNWVRVRRW